MLPFMFSMVLSDKQARSSKKVTNVIYFVMFRKAEIFRSNNNDKETKKHLHRIFNLKQEFQEWN